MRSRVFIGEAAYLGKRNKQLDHEKENSLKPHVIDEAPVWEPR